MRDQLELEVLAEGLQGVEYPGHGGGGRAGAGCLAVQRPVQVLQQHGQDVGRVVGDLGLDELRELAQHVQRSVPHGRVLVLDPRGEDLQEVVEVLGPDALHAALRGHGQSLIGGWGW